MTIGQITDFLDARAPLALQESFDNAGLLVGNKDHEAGAALICLDVTHGVLDEAIEKGCRLIISHHPLIFKPLKSITGQTEIEQIILRAIRHDLAIYAIHTNLDNLHHGVSMALADALGLKGMRVLRPLQGNLRKLVTFCPLSHAAAVRDAMFNAGAGNIGQYDSCSFNLEGKGTFRALEGSNPYVGLVGDVHEEAETRIEVVFPNWKQTRIINAMMQAHPYEEVAYDVYPLLNEDPYLGSGMIGELEDPTEPEAFLLHVKSTLGIPVLRHSLIGPSKLKKIALCGGSGAFLIPDARRQGADIFLSGDFKYHDFQALGGMLLADIGHFESEQFALHLLKDWLSNNFPNFAAHITSTNTNPVYYL